MRAQGCCPRGTLIGGSIEAGKQTERITPEELDAARRAPRSPRGTGLLVYHRDGVRFVPLYPERPVVLGRDPPPGEERLAIDDPGLSRAHARFNLSGDVVEVVDCGSRNGTWHLGVQRERVELSPGDEVRLGAVPVVVHGEATLRTPLRPLSHEGFRIALEEEATRARHFRRALALIMIRAEGDQGNVSGFHATVSERLRPVDRLAFYSHEILEVLLPEMGLEDARRFAADIVAPSRDRAVSLLAGVAAPPNTAPEPEALMEVCLGALRAARATERVQVAGSGGGPAGGRGGATARDTIVAGAALRDVFALADKFAPSTLPILLHGETGVGKDVLAQRIHTKSGRRGAFVVINCGAIPETLVESTLFGHVRGAFTGATQQQTGVFEQANGGTLMLDEVGDLPKTSQASLLRVLEAGRVRRVGAASEVEVHVRVIAATHRDLDAMTQEGTFRDDLLYRLGGARVEIPPLRERDGEIGLLIQEFLPRFSEANSRAVTRVDPRAMALMEAYPWPGNVRELLNAVERAVVLARADTITAEDLPDRVRLHRGGSAAASPPANASAPDEAEPEPEDDNLKRYMARCEARHVAAVLNACGGNQTAAAERLGVSLRTVVNKLNQLDIKRPPFEAPGRRQRARG